MTRKIDPRYEEYLFDKLSDTNHPDDFARYIEKGGEITDEMRVLLVTLIRKQPQNSVGQKDQKRDIDVYWEVEEWQREIGKARVDQAALNSTSKDNADNSATDDMTIEDFEAIDAAIREKYPSLQEAFLHFTSDEEDAEVKTATYQKQYGRGRELLRGNTTSSHIDRKK